MPDGCEIRFITPLDFAPEMVQNLKVREILFSPVIAACDQVNAESLLLRVGAQTQGRSTLDN